VGVLRPGHPFAVFPAPNPLCGEDEVMGEPALTFWAGLEPAARAVLTRAAHRIETIGLSHPLPAPRPARLGRLDVYDQPLLDCVYRHERALVRYCPEEVDPVLLVAQVALAWPKKSLAVVVPGIGEARQVRDRLRGLGIRASAVSSDNRPARVGRVVVSTPVGLAHHPVNSESREIVIVLDALSATGKQAMDCLGHASRARLFGLLDRDARPSPLERDFLACVFGFVSLAIPRHGHRDRAVRVLRHPIYGGLTLPADLGFLALKRRGLWHHAVRNRQIARIARAFRARDGDSLLRLFPEQEAVCRAFHGQGVLVVGRRCRRGYRGRRRRCRRSRQGRH
jgi:hypothetical protein